MSRYRLYGDCNNKRIIIKDYNKIKTKNSEKSKYKRFLEKQNFKHKNFDIILKQLKKKICSLVLC